jgi:hypothetical protein
MPTNAVYHGGCYIAVRVARKSLAAHTAQRYSGRAVHFDFILRIRGAT